eukprot:CAMPEP_0173058692 /NCGR_PEP_ID=MMETSP1102-20130122/1506_1 /TAXON_ID=49646 /ORGANISM="Geminigera sp., Strain Caron Lab Isolate" /LENGTH=152 /DNA_ID=CAMNT_0013924485 /DNA_START=80 /DNA_END=538 /DNA_ORIENTATION=-
MSYTLVAGTVGGTRLIFKGFGDQAPHANSGDVILSVNELKHSRFLRKGENLHSDVYLTLEEALLGWSREIEHLDGEILHVSHHDVVKSDPVMSKTMRSKPHDFVTPMGSSLQIGGKGMAGSGYKRGALVLHLKIQIPELSEEQQEGVKFLLP